LENKYNNNLPGDIAGLVSSSPEDSALWSKDDETKFSETILLVMETDASMSSLPEATEAASMMEFGSLPSFLSSDSISSR
jgi:hypothetical protein